MEKERRAKEEALRQREELEFRLRKFEAAARKANDKLVSGWFDFASLFTWRTANNIEICTDFAATSSSSNYYLQQRSEEAAEILEEKVKFAEEEANLLAKQATEAQQEILRIRQENNKVPASSRLMQLLGYNAM